MAKSRSRKLQRAGDWSSWFSSFGQSAKNSASGAVNALESGLGSAWEGTKSVGSSIGSAVGLSDQQPPYQSQQAPYQSQQAPYQPQQQAPYQMSQGGRKRRHSRKMRGGKGGLGLTYYASPVSGLKVAEPTYWEVYGDEHIMKAGSRRRRKMTKKSRRHRKH